jgi:hypothetical protein
MRKERDRFQMHAPCTPPMMAREARAHGQGRVATAGRRRPVAVIAEAFMTHQF